MKKFLTIVLIGVWSLSACNTTSIETIKEESKPDDASELVGEKESSESTSIGDKATPEVTNCLPHYSNLNEFLHLPTSADTWWIDSADFNGDGYPDILVTRGNYQTKETFELQILLNDKEGSFSIETDKIFIGEVPKLLEPREVVLADFNGDSIMDIFVADQGMDRDPWPGHQNTLVLSAPGGRMVDATINIPQQSDQTHSATTADIDGDGDMDLFVGNMGGGGISPQIWLNDGQGVFTITDNILPPEHTNLSLNWYTTAEFVDINNNGYPDMVLGQGDPNHDSHIVLNDGTGHFYNVDTPLPKSHFAPEQNTVDIKAGDITGDGYQDLFLVDTRGSTYIGWHIQVLINNGDGRFRDETSSRLPQSGGNDGWMFWVDLIDLNMDGHLDIAATPAGGQGGPLFYINDGEGVFSGQPNIFHIEHSYLWTFLDINQDGYLDAFWSYPRGGSSPEIHFKVIALGCP